MRREGVAGRPRMMCRWPSDVPIDICWQSDWSALCFGMSWTHGGNLQFMSQGKLRASLGRGSGALLTQPRAYIIIPYDQAINSSNEQNHYTQKVLHHRLHVPWQNYADLTYRSSGKAATNKVLGEVRKSLRSDVISPASVDIDKVVAQKEKKDIERNGGFSTIKQKPTDLKFWVPGTMQVLCWVGSPSSGKGSLMRRAMTKEKKGVWE